MSRTAMRGVMRTSKRSFKSRRKGEQNNVRTDESACDNRRLVSAASRMACSNDAAAFVREFVAFTGLCPSFDGEYLKALERLVAYLRKRLIRGLPERRRYFLAHANWKFRLNSEPLAAFYTRAAEHGITFNYQQKCTAQRAFDLSDRALLDELIRARGVSVSLAAKLRQCFQPVSTESTLAHLRAECANPSKLRKEKGERDIEGEIVKAQFSAFMWCSLSEPEMHAYFDPYFAEAEYRESFWEQLQVRSPHLFNRNHALHIARLDQSVSVHPSYEALRGSVCSMVERAFASINNHGFLAIILDPFCVDGRDVRWELTADVMLFAEKHREVSLDKGYFRPDKIRDATAAYIPTLDAEAARFDLANEGFTYRDCFVLASTDNAVERLLLIFQKNERDETPIACPTCRSSDVQGNSYPSLGVRSWECNNLLCPDRSKYNRGKRYSFRSLVMQQATDDDENRIPVESVRRWSRDVVLGVSVDEILDMLLRHYSMHGDTVHLDNWCRSVEGARLGRAIRSIPAVKITSTPKARFWDGPFFHRYVCPTPIAATKRPTHNMGSDNFAVLNGDAEEVLRSVPSGGFDGAVTSPPYYNAREYAQWPNIYCYLFDMLRVGREVFRTLKPGALYLYNLFDYFDNENSVVFSAMGQKRMLLSAYTVDLFRRIGFECVGNVVWDKGEIEGKRGFNAGNFSPYYQSPFNCWEHVLVFRKPGSGRCIATDYVLPAKPVLKMVRGENTHGHTAPFPAAIPELIVTAMQSGEVVLDPFGGSLTTGRVAVRHGVDAVCIERSAEY